MKLTDNNRKVTRVEEDQPYPDHHDRFYGCHQLLCKNPLNGRCYWEIEWCGGVHISVSYRRILRRRESDAWFGGNEESWSLFCTDGGYSVWHNKRGTSIPSFSSTSSSNRAAVYVDCPAGTLSFYKVSSDTLMHLYTFNTTFTEPLYAGIGFWSWSVLPPCTSVNLCSVREEESPYTWPDSLVFTGPCLEGYPLQNTDYMP